MPKNVLEFVFAICGIGCQPSWSLWAGHIPHAISGKLQVSCMIRCSEKIFWKEGLSNHSSLPNNIDSNFFKLRLIHVYPLFWNYFNFGIAKNVTDTTRKNKFIHLIDYSTIVHKHVGLLQMHVTID